MTEDLLYSTGALRRVVQNLDEPRLFLLSSFFTLIQEETSEEIHFDVDLSKPRLTPFVSPKRPGRVVEQTGYRTDTFKPAYVKDKREFDPSAPLKRVMGEQIGGNLSPMERRAIKLRQEIADQLLMLSRREEVMASEVLRTGKVTVTGDGYPTKVVDFERDPALTVTLTGTSRWGQSDATPVENIEDWATLIQDKSGAVVNQVVMDPAAWRLFRVNDRVKELLDTRRGSASVAEIGPKDARKARFMGTIGDFEFWVYQDSYVDDDGQVKKVLPNHTVIMSGPELLGTRCYGAIQDEKAGYTATRYFIKSWLEEDPAIRWLLLQCAPLVVPYRVNASLCATVAS
jgi:hypothetical protein